MTQLLDVPPVLKPLLPSAVPDAVEVRRGEVWLLSWDGKCQGLVCIASIQSDYVLAWPVTLPDELAYPPALHLAETPLGLAMNVWPTMEIGMGMHLLDRSLGSILSPEQIRSTTHAIDDGEHPPLPFADAQVGEAGRARLDQERVDHWTRVCFHTLDRPSEKFLSPAALKAHGLQSRDVAAALSLTPPEMRLIVDARRAVTDSQLDLIAQLANAAPADFVEPDRLAPVISLMSHPRHKASIVEAVQARSADEARIRALACAQLPLVARDDRGQIDDGRIQDAIRRVRDGQS